MSKNITEAKIGRATWRVWWCFCRSLRYHYYWCVLNTCLVCSLNSLFAAPFAHKLAGYMPVSCNSTESQLVVVMTQRNVLIQGAENHDIFIVVRSTCHFCEGHHIYKGTQGGTFAASFEHGCTNQSSWVRQIRHFKTLSSLHIHSWPEEEGFQNVWQNI